MLLLTEMKAEKHLGAIDSLEDVNLPSVALASKDNFLSLNPVFREK